MIKKNYKIEKKALVIKLGEDEEKFIESSQIKRKNYTVTNGEKDEL